MKVFIKDCYRGAKCNIKGYTYWENKLCRGATFEEIISKANDVNELVNISKKLSGSFVFTIIINGELYVVTDVIRSLPLFWGIVNNELVITDDVQLFKVEERAVCDSSVYELMATAYVTNNNTLYEGVYQFEVARVYRFDNNKLLSVDKYYYVNTPKEAEILYCIENMKQAYNIAFNRLVDYLGGRQAVIPLSGGLDARFILANLIKRNYRNIVAFTYGKQEKEEVLASKKIAETYGVKWIYVPYASSKMRRLFYSNEFDEVGAVAGNIAIMPMLQDWYAIKYLKENKMIEKDAIIIPGHAPSSMSEVAPIALQNQMKDISFERSEVADLIYATNYVYWNVENEDIRRCLIKKIESNIPKGNTFSLLETYDLVKNFCYEERQSKHIANSVRVYEYYEFDWYMPYWDINVAFAWNKVTKEFCDKRKIYRMVIEQVCPECLAIIAPVGGDAKLGEANGRGSVKEVLFQRFPKMYRILRALLKQKDNMNLWGYLSVKDKIYAAVKGQMQVDSMWIYAYLKRCCKGDVKCEKFVR